jgi:GGDEF domain-containing protein
VEARRQWDGMTVTADAGTMGEVARILCHEVRDTDLLGSVENGGLWLALLDTDGEGTRRVIDRIVQRIDSYDFPAPLHISMGAACCPTDAVDASSLKQRASARPVLSWRGGASFRSGRGDRS